MPVVATERQDRAPEDVCCIHVVPLLVLIYMNPVLKSQAARNPLIEHDIAVQMRGPNAIVRAVHVSGVIPS